MGGWYWYCCSMSSMRRRCNERYTNLNTAHLSGRWRMESQTEKCQMADVCRLCTRRVVLSLSRVILGFHPSSHAFPPKPWLASISIPPQSSFHAPKRNTPTLSLPLYHTNHPITRQYRQTLPWSFQRLNHRLSKRPYIHSSQRQPSSRVHPFTYTYLRVPIRKAPYRSFKTSYLYKSVASGCDHSLL